jgi:alpha-amylase/alpha-mannosidase (GH57 family)
MGGGPVRWGGVSQPVLAVHGHFYQPPRENPWTETVPVERSAAPFHDWNERVCAESYRPNGWARVVDEHGRVLAIVNNYAYLSFDVGPTLASWLADAAPDVLARMVEGDAVGGGAIAQAYNHLILPLASERDVRTQVRWGLADFAHRFGRPAEGMWLPETAVNDTVMRVLAEEGVGFTVLAPGQALAVRPLGGDEAWRDVADGSIDTRRSYRWVHPDDPALGVDVVFYDGPLSHDVAFAAGGLSSQALVARARLAAPAGGLVCVAADGETFGHHHTFAERAIAYALPVEAPRSGIEVSTVAAWLRRHPPQLEVQVRESSWSCAHGVARWRADCGCSTGGPPGADQKWRAPLRGALDLLGAAVTEVFERRAPAVLKDGWAARDDYIDVLLGRRSLDDFAADHVVGDRVEAFTLLELERHAMLMYTSCGWFFWDLAGIETVQVLRYAARAMDLLGELGEDAPRDEFLAVLAEARSNQPGEGDGRAVWDRHVMPSRVDDRRVVAHLALADLLERGAFSGPLATYNVALERHRHDDRGPLALASGIVTLTHRRTGRRTRHTYAALHLGGLEIYGGSRATGDEDADAAELGALHEAFAAGERVAVLLRGIAALFAEHEFGLDSALPDAADQIVKGAARALTERFAAAYEQLFADHRPLITTLARAGFTLPPELRVPADLALARRFRTEIERDRDGADDVAYATAAQLGRDAMASGFEIDSPESRAAIERALLDAVAQTIAEPMGPAVDDALALLRLVRELGLHVNVDRAQDMLYEALTNQPHTPALELLGVALDLAVDRLGVPEP